jgi:hypothetical protein
MRAVLDSSRFKVRDNTRLLPHSREVVNEGYRVKDLGEKGYRSLGKMFRALFGKQLGPGALLNSRPLMTS